MQQQYEGQWVWSPAIYRSWCHFASASVVFAFPFLVLWIAFLLDVSLWILCCTFILSIKYFQFSSQGQYSIILPYTLEVICGHECTLAKECEHQWHVALLGRSLVPGLLFFLLLWGSTACSMSLNPRVRIMQTEPTVGLSGYFAWDRNKPVVSYWDVTHIIQSVLIITITLRVANDAYEICWLIFMIQVRWPLSLKRKWERKEKENKIRKR